MIRILCALLVLSVLTACASTAKIELRAASQTDVPGALKLIPPGSLGPSGSERPVFVEPLVIIGNADIASAFLSQANQGQRAVTLTLTEAGAGKLYDYTSTHVDEPIAIMVDGELYSAPIIKSPLRVAMITRGPDGLTEEQAQRIIRSVNR